MRAATLTAGRFSVATTPDPVPTPGAVVLRVAACGICGTDHMYVRSRLLPDGTTLGHEFAGTVEEVGPGVGGWRPGDAAAVVPILYCGACEWCVSGRENLCPAGTKLTIGCGGGAGGMAERAVVPASALRRLPGDLDVRLGALVEPTAVAYHAVGLGEVRPGSRVAIVGLGPIGLLAGMLARRQGATVFGLDLRAARLACGRRLGLEVLHSDAAADEQIRERTAGGPDVVVEASGRAESVERAAGLARVGGRVVMVSAHHTPAEIHPIRWLARSIALLPSLAYTPRDFDAALALVADGTIDARQLVTGTTSLGGVQRLFDDVESDAIKVLIDPSLPESRS